MKKPDWEKDLPALVLRLKAQSFDSHSVKILKEFIQSVEKKARERRK